MTLQLAETVDKAPSLRILCFASKEAWPPNTGARMRHYYLTRELARRAQVTYLSFAEDGTPRREATAVPEHFSSDPREADDDLFPLTHGATRCERVISVPLDKRYTLGKIMRGAFRQVPLPVLNYEVQSMQQELKRLLNDVKFDLVLLESFPLISYLPLIRASRYRPLVICDWHNIESEVMQRYSLHASYLACRAYGERTAHRLAALELKAISLFDGHLTVSERDHNHLKKLGLRSGVCVVENGVDVMRYRQPVGVLPGDGLGPLNSSRRVLFVGSMDYHANIDAVTYFANKFWPAVYKQVPSLTFTIVGRNPPKTVMRLARRPGIEVSGTVEDVRPFYRDAVAAVVPLRVGGGSRLKILEAFASGVPVISTSLGAEGLAVTDHKDILLADSVDGFTNLLVEVTRNTELRDKLITAGFDLARLRYDWKTIGGTLYDFCYWLCCNRGSKTAVHA